MTAVSEAIPYQASTRTLMRASLAAATGAVAILILFVLPAEWGVDLTGVGQGLGLTRMAKAADIEPEAASPAQTAVQAMIIPPQTKENIEARTAERSDEKTVTLAPHTGIEIKAHMLKGDHLIFRWTSTAPVRMDMHGEPSHGKEGEFSTYWKQKDLTEAQGSFTAQFDGKHGWYWRNGAETPATITLKTNGFYQDLFEPPVG